MSSRTQVNPGRTTSFFSMCPVSRDRDIVPSSPTHSPSRLHLLKVPVLHNNTVGTNSQHLKSALSGSSDGCPLTVHSVPIHSGSMKTAFQGTPWKFKSRSWWRQGCPWHHCDIPYPRFVLTSKTLIHGKLQALPKCVTCTQKCEYNLKCYLAFYFPHEP